MARNTSKVTTDHEEIRRWVEERGGSPACVRGTGGEGDTGMIRIDMPGFSGERSLEHISWEEWFKSFDKNKLALLHQDTLASGGRSNFNKLIGRDTAEKRQRGASRHRPQGRRRGASAGSESTGRRASRGGAASRSRRGSGTRSRSERGSRASGRRTRATASTRSRSTRSRSAGRKRTATRSASSRTRRSTSARSQRKSSARSQRSSRSQSRSRSTQTRARRPSRKSSRGGNVVVARKKIRRLKKDVRNLDNKRAA